MIKLPIDKIKNEILEALAESSNIIIKSSPGSGKTTRVPLYLKEVTHKTILVLEPRKIAARWAAEFMAKELNEEVSKTVGYRYRFENKTNQQTQIQFLTEGTFIRLLSDESFVSNIGFIIFDEFHERHLSTDQSLAFSQKLIEKYPIKRIFMSATLDTTELEAYLKNSKVITQEENLHPLKINYIENNSPIVKESKEFKINSILENIDSLPGDVLVFLEGISEIRTVSNKISHTCAKKNWEVHILHSQNTPSETAMALTKSHKRKIILATNIAESSLTIDGVQIVIDGGTHKEKSFDYFTMLDRYSTSKTSQANSIQRSGRSNRQGPGVTFRLFSEQDFLSRKKNIEPEIVRSNLIETIFESFKLFSEFQISWFLTHPNSGLIEKSLGILNELKILKNHQLTNLGESIADSPFHPRISVIIDSYLKSQMFKDDNKRKDFLFSMRNLFDEDPRFELQLSQYINFKKNSCSQNSRVSQDDLDFVFFTGFTDLLCKLNTDTHPPSFIHRSGQSFRIFPETYSKLDHTQNYWCITQLNLKNEVKNAFPIEKKWILEYLQSELNQSSQLSWCDYENVLKSSKVLLGSLLISEELKKIPISKLTINELKEYQLLLKDQYQNKLKHFKDTPNFLRINRLAEFLSIELHDNFLSSYLEILLDLETLNGPDLDHSYMLEELKQLLISESLKILKLDSSLDLDREIPLTIKLHDKRTLAIDYNEPKLISVTGYIQDFYGLKNVPLLLNGKLPLTVNLLGPHKRILQRTNDLSSFWKNTYPTMKSELKRDYPKHYWPDDPEKALPILLLKNVKV